MSAVEIDAKMTLDLSDLKSDLSNLKSELDKSLNSDAVSGLDEGAQQLRESLQGVSETLKNIESDLGKLSDASVLPTEVEAFHVAFGELSNDIQGITSDLTQMGQSSESFTSGFDSSVQKISSIANDFENVSASIARSVEMQDTFGESVASTMKKSEMLTEMVQGMFQTDMFENASDKIQQIGYKLQDTANKAVDVRDNIISMLEANVPTTEFSKLESELDGLKAKADEVKVAFAEMTGGRNIEDYAFGSGQVEAKFGTIVRTFESLQTNIQNVESQMQNLVDSGQAFNSQAELTPQAFDKAVSSAETLNLKLASQLSTMEAQIEKEDELAQKEAERAQQNHYAELIQMLNDAEKEGLRIDREREQAQREAQKNALNAYNKVQNVLKTIGKYTKDILNTTKQIITAVGGALINGLSKAANLAKKIGSALSSSVKSAGDGFKNVSKGASDSAESMAKFTKRMILLAVGTRSVFALLRKIRTEVVQGMTDAINSVDTVKSSVDGLKQTFANLKGQISMAFLPLVEVAIPYIQQVCAWLSNMINLIAQAIAALTGASTWRKVTGVDRSKMTGAGGSKKKGKSVEEKNAEKQAKVDKQNAKKQAAYDKKVANAYKKADEQEAKVNERNAKALEKYEKAQRKAAEADKKRLSGLDILNNMTTTETEVEEPELEEFDKEAYLADLLDGIGELELAVADLEDDLGAGGIGAISWVEEEIDQRVKDFIEWLKSMWETGDFSELGRWIGEHLRDWLNAIPWDEIQEKARKVGKSIATLIDGLVSTEGLAEAIGRTIAQGYLTVFHFLDELVTDLPWAKIGKFLADGLNEFGRVITENWDVIYHTLTQLADGLADFINSFVDNFNFDYLSEIITKALSTIADAITTFFQKVNSRQLGFNLGEQLMKILGDAETWGKVGTAIGSALNSIINLIIGFFQNISYEDIKASIGNFMKKFKEAFDFDSFKDDLYDVIVNLWTTIRQALIDLSSKITEWIGQVNWYELGQKIGNKIKEILQDKELLSKVGEAAGSIIGALVDALSGVIDTVSWGDVISAFQTLWDSFKDKIDMGRVAKLLLGALKDAIILNIPSILGGVGSLIAGSLFKSFLIKQAVSKAIEGAGLEGLGKGISQSLLFGANSAWNSLGGFKGLLTTDLGTIMKAGTAKEAGLAIASYIGIGITEFFAVAELSKKVAAWIFPSDADLYKYYSGIDGTLKAIKDSALSLKDVFKDAFEDEASHDYDKYTKNVLEKSGIREYREQVQELIHEYENGRITAESFNKNVLNLVRSSETYGNVATDAMGRVTNTAIQANGIWEEANEKPEQFAQHLIDVANQIPIEYEGMVQATNDAVGEATESVQTYADAFNRAETDVKNSVTSQEEAIKQGTELQRQAMDGLHQSNMAAKDSTDQAADSAQGLKSSLDSTADSAENLADKVQLSADMVASMLDQLKSQIADADWAEIWSPVKTGFEEFWNTFKTDVETQVQGLLSELPNMVSSNLNMSSILEPINTEISEFMNTVKTTVSSKMGEITTAVQDGITNLKVSIGSSLQGINDSFANAFKGITEMVGNVMRNMSQTFTQGLQVVARSYGSGWESMVRTTHSAVQQMMNMINSLLNQLRRVPQALSQTMQQMDRVSQQMNKLSNVTTSSNKLSNLVNKLKGSVTPYASGGVIPPTMAEHLALLGDNKRETEVVSPLSTMKQAMAEVLAGMNMTGGSSGDIVVEIDGREVFRAMRNENSQYMKQNGGRSAFA